MALLPALTIALSSCATSKVKEPDVKAADKSIVILYENDVHCGIDGYAKMAGLRDAIRDTAYAELVSSGDYLQGGTAGAISKGQYIADIMKHMHYAAITVGNHEFDYYLPRMEQLLADINAPVVCCNLFDMQGKLIYAPYIIRSVGTKKIAFIGIVTPTTRYMEEYAFFDNDGKQLIDLHPDECYTLVQQSVDEARSKGADYVIVLSHLGEDRNSLNVDSHGLIASTNGIDVVLDGHTHSVIPTDSVCNKDGKQVLITQTGTKFWNVGKLLITKDGHMSTELISTKKIEVENAEVRQVTDSIKALAREITSRPICKSEVDLVILDENEKQRVRREETNAGDIVADSYRIMTGSDIAMTNGGGIRTQVKAGSLTYGDIISLLPYDNYVSIVEITGKQLKNLLAETTKNVPHESGDFPQVSGMKFTVNVGKEEPITDLVILNKATGEYEPVEPERTYNLATIDYCITGGGFLGMLKNNNVLKPNIMIYNECLIQYITEKLGGHIGKEYALPQGRINIVK